MVKKIMSVLFLASMETIFLGLVHDFVFNSLLPPTHPDVNWGISLQIAVLEFIILSIILNAFLVSYSRIHPFWPIVAAIFVYSLVWIDDLLVTPSSTMKLLVSATLGFLSYYPFSALLKMMGKRSAELSNLN
jgi:hypothetical protein